VLSTLVTATVSYPVEYHTDIECIATGKVLTSVAGASAQDIDIAVKAATKVRLILFPLLMTHSSSILIGLQDLMGPQSSWI